MNSHQILDVSVAAGSSALILAAWALIRLTFRRGRGLEEA